MALSLIHIYSIALDNGYFIASLFLSLLAISCYLGITNGNIIIFSKRIDLADVLWFIIFLSSAIEYGTKYVYLKQKKRFVYYDILVTWSSWMSFVYSEIIGLSLIHILCAYCT